MKAGKRKERFFGFGSFALCFLLLPGIMFVTMTGGVYADDLEVEDEKLERAVLSEDWASVTTILEDVGPGTPSPVLRLIKAHACLDLNLNNESLCLFYSVTTDKEFEKWKTWTIRFSDANPNSSIAHLFIGDAYARLKKWDDSLNEMNIALDLAPKSHMALNARGVVYSAMMEWDRAILDFDEATKVNPKFADAYASRGVLYIMKRSSATGALKWFKKAIDLTPDFALAINGRGCARYALGMWDEAESDFRSASDLTECLPQTFLNIYALMDTKCKYGKKEAEELAKDNPGFATALNIKAMEFGRAMTHGANAFHMGTQTFYGSVKDMNPIMELKMRPNGITAGVSAQPDFKTNHEYMKNLTNTKMVDNYTKINGLNTDIQNMRADYDKNPSGVTADLKRAFVDEGDWKVDTFYGMFYVVEGVGGSSEEKVGQKR